MQFAWNWDMQYWICISCILIPDELMFIASNNTTYNLTCIICSIKDSIPINTQIFFHHCCWHYNLSLSVCIFTDLRWFSLPFFLFLKGKIRIKNVTWVKSSMNYYNFYTNTQICKSVVVSHVYTYMRTHITYKRYVFQRD